MKKRIALVVNTLSGGGAERTVSNLSRGLCGRYDIDLIVNDREHLEYPYKGRLISLEMPADGERMGALYEIGLLLRRTSVLRHLKKKRRYAAVISFSGMSNLANVLSGKRYGKVIISVRNSVLKGMKGSRVRQFISSTILRWCCRTSDMTVSCSKGIADELENYYGLRNEKSAVIYNGLEIPMIRKKAAEKVPDLDGAEWKDRKLIVTAGRLTYQKGQWHLLRAVRKLADEGFPVHPLILGEGELEPVLRSEALRLGISNMVTFAGFAENPYKYMARADVVVMSSLYEGFCNVILEALACGVPVISTDHETGAREILAPDTDYHVKVTDRVEAAAYGILVPVCKDDFSDKENEISGQESLMADAIREVLTEEELRQHYRKAALQRAGQLDISQICKKWEDLIEGIC